MPYLLNFLYLSLAVLFSPWLLYKLCTTAKWRRNLATKFLGRTPRREGDRPCVWFHGVSVGEVHLLRQVVAKFRQARPECDVVISASTVTGLEEARKHFPELQVICWPLDFTWAVKRALRNIRPALVVLAESEIWPNFLLAAKKFGAKVAVINGRMSPRSAARYRQAAFLVRWLLRKVDLWAMQNEEYAAGVRELLGKTGGDGNHGSHTTYVSHDSHRSYELPPDPVAMTGNVKYDGVNTDRDSPRTREFGRLFGIEGATLAAEPLDSRSQAPPGNALCSSLRLDEIARQSLAGCPFPVGAWERESLVWVAGSTQMPEEEIVLAIYQKMKPQFPALRLILVPRQKERFDPVADLLQKSGLPFVRRSQLAQTASGDASAPRVLASGVASAPRVLASGVASAPRVLASGVASAPRETRDAVILGDTFGELSAVWGLADIAFVGGSMDGQRGGQNMIEPAAYGAAVVFGPHTWNFKDTVTRLLGLQAAIQIQDAVELEHRIRELAQDAALRQQLGQAARKFVQSQQGATERTIALLQDLLVPQQGKKAAA